MGPIIVKFPDLTATSDAIALQRDNYPLLAAIPMEEMDVIIHYRRQELLVNPQHPFMGQLSFK